LVVPTNECLTDRPLVLLLNLIHLNFLCK
jgi:hypothetical protein